jgi:hypothetical protein
MQGVAEFGAALEQTRSDPRIGEQMREFAQRQFDRGGLNQRNALAAYSAAYGAIVNGDPRDVQSSLAIGSAFNVLAGPGSRAGEAGTAMLLSQLAASDLPSDEVMRRVNAASSFVIDAKRDAARYGLEQAMLNRLDGVNLWNAPAMQAGLEVASIWGATQIGGTLNGIGPSRGIPGNNAGLDGIGGAGQSGASLPLGSKRLQFNQPENPSYQPIRNDPTTIGKTEYSGHAIDRMQDRGIMPTVVQNTIDTGVATPSRLGTTVYYDPVNNVSVVRNAEGRVVTVKYGR